MAQVPTQVRLVDIIFIHLWIIIILPRAITLLANVVGGRGCCDPKGALSGTDNESYQKLVICKFSLNLVAICDPVLPSIDIDKVSQLGDLLRRYIVWGPLKLSERWNMTSWPLDCLIEYPQTTLDQAGLLPLDSAPLTRAPANMAPAPPFGPLPGTL